MIGAKLPFPQLPELIQQGLEEFLSVEGQLVVQPQEGCGKGPFRNLGDRALLLAIVAAIADPVYCSTRHFSAADAPAVSTEDVPGVSGSGGIGAPVELLFPSPDQLLCPLEILPTDDAHMVILHIIGWLLSSVLHLLNGECVGSAGFLPDRIAGVEAVGQDVADHGCMPSLPAMAAFYAQLVQILADIGMALPVERRREDVAHHLNLMLLEWLVDSIWAKAA